MKNSTRLAFVALLSLGLLPVPSPADPPPWAPAHGWRKKNDPNYVGYTGKKWDKDYGIIEGRGNSAADGAVRGGAIGGAGGARATNKENRPVASRGRHAVGGRDGSSVEQANDESR